MTKYILHGGFTKGEKQENHQFFQEIVKDTPEKLRILLVYFAKDADRIDQNAEEDKEQFIKNGGGKTLLFEIAREASFEGQVKESNIVYLHGGHSGKLLQVLKKFPNLVKLFDNKIVAGDSAGANVLCKNFYSLKIGAHEGLGILSIKIISHYTEESKHKLDEFNQDLSTLFLPEYSYKVFNV